MCRDNPSATIPLIPKPDSSGNPTVERGVEAESGAAGTDGRWSFVFKKLSEPELFVVVVFNGTHEGFAVYGIKELPELSVMSFRTNQQERVMA